MPYTPCAIMVEPAGSSVAVTIKRNSAGGAVITAYTAENGSSTFASPATVTTRTIFWLTSPGVFYVSLLVDGDEAYGRTVDLPHYSRASVTPDVEVPGLGDFDALAAKIAPFGTPTVRVAVTSTPRLYGPDAVASNGTLTQNTVGIGHAPSVHGDFTGITGSDAGWWWGENIYSLVESDTAGLTHAIGGLIELAVEQTTGTIDVAQGFSCEVSLVGADAGATLTLAESLRVNPPQRKLGATGGTIVQAVAAHFGAPTIGTSSNFSILCDGVARFQARVDVWNNISNAGASNLNIFAGGVATDGGRLDLQTAANGGHIRSNLQVAGAAHQVTDGTNVQHGFFASGAYFLRDSSTPATPTSGIHIYSESGVLKYKNSSGTVKTITVT